uniref:Odorant receptor n=1 Tax=Dendroctonus ponderosae TaxID=77166 RepID=A0AAR5PUH7_DENPD
MDFVQLFAPFKLILNISGFWPQKNPKPIVKVRKVFTLLVNLFFCLSLSIQCLFLRSQIEEFLDVLTVITPPVAYLFKQIVFFGHSSAFLTLMDFLKDDDLVSIPLQLRKQISDSLQVAKIIGVGYQACCTMTILFIVIWPMFTEHQLPVQFTLFDLGDFYAFMYLLQIFALANAAANSSSLDLIALTLMCIVKGQICVLNDKIRSLEEINASKGHGAQRVKYVSGCVLHHTKIIELVALIENVYSQIVLIEYLTSMVVICNIGFQLVIVELASFAFLLMLTFLVTMLCQLGMYCWFGNEIMLHSAAIRDACYESDWIHSCPQVRKMLLMIMERSKRPLYLTAGKFSILSLNSFTSVIHSAYSFFALMQRMYGKSTTF